MPDLNALSRGLGAGGLGKGLGGLLGGGAPNGLPGLGGKPSGKKEVVFNHVTIADERI